jgi:hypothetical protein
MNIKKLALLLAMALPTVTQASTITINDPATSSGYAVTSYTNPSPTLPELLVIGVYETRSDHSFSYSPQGSATVNIMNQGAAPLTLVLSSYEPTLWNLNIESGVNINEIILNGYHDQDISGASGVRVTERSFLGTGSYFSACAYAWPSDTGGCDTAGLISGVEAYTGLSLSKFSGVYQATDFTVTTSPVPLPSATFLFMSGLIGMHGIRRKKI